MVFLRMTEAPHTLPGPSPTISPNQQPFWDLGAAASGKCMGGADIYIYIYIHTDPKVHFPHESDQAAPQCIRAIVRVQVVCRGFSGNNIQLFRGRAK
jgi:hypothetical protein